MALNVELLRKIASRLRRIRHEKHYKQTVWIEKNSCGTAACIAGWAVLLSGYKPDTEQGYENNYDYCVYPPTGRQDLFVPDVAKELLELDDEEAGILFAGYPDDKWPEEYAKRWRNRKPRSKDPKKRPSRIAADFLDAIADGKVRL